MSAVGDLVTVRIVATYQGEPIVNDLSFMILNPGETFPLTAQQVVDDLDASEGVISGSGSWTDQRTTQYVVDHIDVLDVLPGVAPLQSFPSSAAGTVDEDGVPGNCNLCCTLRTDTRGQRGRGRLYLCGYSEGLTTAGYWEADAQTAANNILNNLMANYGPDSGGPDMSWVVIHRSEGNPPHPVTPVAQPVTAFTVHNEVRSISRRAIGRRIHRRRHTA
jgi:hypothetical protein